MFGREKKAISMTAIIAALVLGAVSAGVAPDAFALRQAATSNDGSGAPTIRVAVGKLSGKFNDRRLFEVLDEIGGRAGFEYQGDGELLDQLVSGKFEGTSWAAAVRDILKPFRYVMTFDARGDIENFPITGLRRPLKEPGGRAAPLIPQEPVGDDDFISAAPGVELAEEDYRPFEGVEHQDSDIAPELLEAFEPRQAPGTEKTGPPLPEGFVAKELPPFEPIESETGPVDPDIVVKELPDFEPVVSETGPSLEALKHDGASPAAP